MTDEESGEDLGHRRRGGEGVVVRGREGRWAEERLIQHPGTGRAGDIIKGEVKFQESEDRVTVDRERGAFLLSFLAEWRIRRRVEEAVDCLGIGDITAHGSEQDARWRHFPEPVAK